MVAIILLLIGAVYFGINNNIFADISSLNSFGNSRVQYSIVNNNLKLTINGLDGSPSVMYPEDSFYYFTAGPDTEVKQTFDSASISTSGNDHVLKLSDSTKGVSFDLKVVTKSNYLTFEVTNFTKPDGVTFKSLQGLINSSHLSCDATNPNCIGLVTYCLSSNCEDQNFKSGDQVMYFKIADLTDFPIEHSKILLITADHGAKSIEFAKTIELVKKDLGIDRHKSYDPTFFATGCRNKEPCYIYNKANAELVAKKLNDFGYKRILINDLNWQKSRGLWDLNTAAFPDGLKEAVDVFHQNGIQVGLHTLSATVSMANKLYTDRDIAKRANGVPLNPPGYVPNSLYLVNYFDPVSLGNYVDNLTSNITANGIDFVYLDGSEWFGLEAGVNAKAINKEFIMQFAGKTKIDFQASAYTGLYADKYAIADVWKSGHDIADYIDNSLIGKYDSARVSMLLMRQLYIIPNLGWTPLNLDEDPAHYAYALDAAIANGAPFTTETDMNSFMSDVRTDKFQPIFKERLDIYNKIAANSARIAAPTGSEGARLIQFDNDALGVTLPKAGGAYRVDAGSNRRVFIHPWANKTNQVTISFSGLENTMKYALNHGVGLFDESCVAKNNICDFSITIDSTHRDYSFLTLSQVITPPIPETSYTFPTGYSTYGTAATPFPSSLITNQGLSVLKFDGVNNKWLTAPADTFDIEARQGYYVYNPASAKTVSLPTRPDGTLANLYWTTKGWNLLYTTHDQARANLQIKVAAPGAWSAQIDAAVVQQKALPSVFVINDYSARTACEYFTLLESATQPANCATNSLGKVTAVPDGKAFWVYVK